MAKEVITIDRTDLLSVQEKINILKFGSKDAIRFATNDVLKGVVTDSVSAIDQKTSLKPTIIRKNFSIKKMFVSDLRAWVDCRGDPLGLIHYDATSVMKGVNVRLLKNTPKQTVKHAFIAKMRSGHRGVFWRSDRRRGTRWAVGKKRKVPSPRRRSGEEIAAGSGNFQLPIHELYGPRVPDWFDDADVIDIVIIGSGVRLQKRLEYHTERLLDKARAA